MLYFYGGSGLVGEEADINNMIALILERKDIPERFMHVSQDDNLRFRETNGGYILEQKLYANTDENGNWLKYPEMEWFPVKIVK